MSDDPGKEARLEGLKRRMEWMRLEMLEQYIAEGRTVFMCDGDSGFDDVGLVSWAYSFLLPNVPQEHIVSLSSNKYIGTWLMQNGYFWDNSPDKYKYPRLSAAIVFSSGLEDEAQFVDQLCHHLVRKQVPMVKIEG